jgi:hypothetical protein
MKRYNAILEQDLKAEFNQLLKSSYKFKVESKEVSRSYFIESLLQKVLCSCTKQLIIENISKYNSLIKLLQKDSKIKLSTTESSLTIS